MSSIVLFIAISHTTTGLPILRSIDEQSYYPYGGPAFASFVDDSFRGPSGAPVFYRWLDTQYRDVRIAAKDSAPTLTAFVTNNRNLIEHAHDQESKTLQERTYAANLDRLVKLTLPNFSLDQGFEFRNAVSKGERQCFLQSVLITGLLQRAGVPAGVAMVNRNMHRQETNNKHAVCICRLADGHDLIVDASEDEPFVRHEGLFLRADRGYQFVKPIYESKSEITDYEGYESGRRYRVADVLPLDSGFIRSQFEYYRGERARGGLLAKKETEAGIASAAFHLERSVRLCSANPLANYMLGKALAREGHTAAARTTLEDAMRLYVDEGWVPPDERLALLEIRRES